MGVPSKTQYSDSTTTDGSLYIGTCNSAVADADSPVWAIYKLTVDANGDYTLEWAGGDATPNKVWSDRASLTYK